MFLYIYVVIILLSTSTTTTLYAKENNYNVIHDMKTNATIFVFKAERGDVYFNHDLHQLNMGRAQNPSATYLGDNVAWGKITRS
jgi:hypothetical protein